MIDQPKTNPTPSNPENNKTDNCVAGFNTNTRSPHQVNITAMIRSLQRTEGLADCFRRGLADCEQLECAWRQYCLQNADGLPPLNEP